MRQATTRNGFTLVELLLAIAIAAILVLPLAATIRNALAAQSLAQGAHDVSRQARFAMQRMEAAVRATAPHTLSAKATNTTADWLNTVTYCLNGSARLIETVSTDTACMGLRVIADQVSTFSVQSLPATVGNSTVIEIQLSLTAPGGQNITLTSRTRLGGGTS